MTPADPATMAVRHAVHASLADVPPDSLVLVACSGGPDSVALAAATAFLAPRSGRRAGAVVIDHGLQPGSDEVAAWAADCCRRLGLAPAQVSRVQVGREGGLEAAARRARRDELRIQANRLGAEAVLLGHTRDDQAETVLLRLARGSGARSLAAMASVDGLWRRPLLGLSRSVVRASADQVLAAIGERPWQDPHNADPRFARVRVRSALDHLAQALGAGIVPALARSAAMLRDDADALDDLAEQAHAAHVVREEGGSSCEVAALSDMPRALRTRVIRMMCLAAGSDPGALTAEQVWTVDRLVSDWHGQGPTYLPGRVKAQRRYGRLAIHGEP